MKLADFLLSLLFFTSLTLLTMPAYAYLDSGTGSIIIQLLFAGVAGFLAILKLYWEKVKHAWLRFIHLFKRKPPAKPHHDKKPPR